MTLKVTAGIHWEALKLLLKGVRMLPVPSGAQHASRRSAPMVAERTGADESSIRVLETN